MDLKIPMHLKDTSPQGRNIFLAAVMALLAMLSLAVLLVRGAFPTAFSDEFYFFDLYSNAHQHVIDVQDLFSPHFGHVYILLKLWLWSVIRFQLDWRVSMYLGCSLIAVTAGLVFYYANKTSRNGAENFACLAMALAVCSARQSENFYWAIQLSVALTILSAVSAFIFVEEFQKTQNVGAAWAALLLATVSLVSSGSGVAAFVLTGIAVVVTAGKLIRLKWIAGGYFIAVFLLWVMLNFSHGQGSSSDGNSILSIGTLLTFILSFYANALYVSSDTGGDARTLITGGAVLIVAALFLINSIKAWQRQMFPLLLFAFSALTCLMIAFARLRSGIYQPGASRYYPFAMPIVVATLMTVSRDGTLAATRSKVLNAVSTVVCLAALLAYGKEWKISPYRYTYMLEAHAHLCSGGTEGLAFIGDLKNINLPIIRSTFCR